MSASPSEGLFVCFVPDGNRRWEARKQLATPSALSPDQLQSAYAKGEQVVRELVEVARQSAVGILALFGWSEGNEELRSHEERRAVFSAITNSVAHLEQVCMHQPSYADVRLVHMGRKDRLGPALLERIESLCDKTRDRVGMVVALCCDYGGLSEIDRAVTLWGKAGMWGDWREFLDLPRQGVPYRTVDGLIRIGEDRNDIVHDSAALIAYRGPKAQMMFLPTLLPDYSIPMFQDHLRLIVAAGKERRGGK